MKSEKMSSNRDSKENIRTFVQNKGGIRMLKMLEEGTISDINIRDSSWDDGTALMYQAADGTVESMESLLAHKPPALVNLQDEDGRTALHRAVYSGDNPAKVRLLLDHGADQAKRDYYSRTALDIARNNNYTECIKVLESYIPKPRG